MRHKSENQKLRFCHNVIEENIGPQNGERIMFLSYLEAKLRLAECTIFWCCKYEENGSKNCPFYHCNVNLHCDHMQPIVKPM